MTDFTVEGERAVGAGSAVPAWMYRDARESRLSGLLRRAYRVRRLRRFCIKAALALEGGPFLSGTVRRILHEYHGVVVGAYSYGGCLEPGRLPRGVSVGRYVSVAQDVRVFLRNHPMARLSMHPYFYNAQLGVVDRDNIPSGTLEIGHDSWIGDRVVIAPGCGKIGIGSVVGAGAVVTKNVPDFAVVAGNPAKLVRFRFDEATCELILSSRWWELPVEELIRELPAMVRDLPEDPCHHPLLRRGNRDDKAFR